MIPFDLVGQQFGDYRLLHLPGEGGFASAYLWEHLYLGMQFAVKVLRPRLTEEEQGFFLNDERVAAALVHPNILRVLGDGIVDGSPYLVMDYAPYGSLRQRHPRGVRMPLEIVLAYVKQVAEALQHAHDGAVHLWDAKTGQRLLTYRATSSGESRLFSHQARNWWTGKTRTRRGSNMQEDLDGDAEEVLPGDRDDEEDELPQDAVLALAWSPDGRRIASGGKDGMISIWRA